MTDSADLTIAEAGRRLRDGSLTAATLTEAHLGRMARLDPELHAFVRVTADLARADATRADVELAAGRDRGPLHGIPIGIKDIIDTAGIPTESGSRLRRGYIPAADAEVVCRLVDAGAVRVGKLTTYEFATVGPDHDAAAPPARNPWDPTRITGGSSSGNAAAVAAGLVRTTIGSDTAGSLRGPASYCGVVGLKPTADLLPATGVQPLSPSLDHIGPISATVADAALTLDAIAPGTDAAAQLGQPLDGLRIAYARDWFATDPATDPAVLSAIDDAASALSLLGARIAEVTLGSYDDFAAPATTILNAESYAIHHDTLGSRAADYGPMSHKSLMTGEAIAADEVTRAHTRGAELRKTLDTAVFAHFDALLTVTTLTAAIEVWRFAGGPTVWTPMRTMGFNLTGHPALSVPAGLIGGLPIGAQLIGPHGGEAMICRIGHGFEQATDFGAQRPSLHAASRHSEPQFA